MAEKNLNKTAENKVENLPSVASYIGGFLLSLILTLTAYFLVARHVNSKHAAISHTVLVFMITALAIIQLLVQLTFFLHVDSEKKPRWNLTVMLFAVTVLVIIVFGSLWIMNNLNYHMDSQQQINKYLRSQGDL
jgi:cytochrome o ubiquinol oxidase operon protein cyoD